MNKYLLLLPLLCTTALLKAQADTVNNKISKLAYKHVDVLAKFPEGDFKNYITSNLQINHKVDYSVSGQIILLMSIGADGNIAHVSIIKSLSPQIDPEVVQVIRASPKWQPAMLNGQKISMDMVLDIDIAVKGAKKTVSPISKVATVNKTLPVIAKKPIPPIVKKPVPVIAKKPVPPVVKKPIPVIAKKPVPVIAKKPIPPIVKKPIPVIAKKPIPPVVKKPVPVIAKNVEQAPIAKKLKRVVTKMDLFHPSSHAPVFPGGGLPAFFKYLSENISYPPGSKKTNIEGKVLITFTVEEDGSVNDVEVESSPAEDLSQEAIRVMLASPKWKPASQNGRNVPVSYTIPIKFSLASPTN